MDINKIKEICSLYGTSSDEKRVREYIINEIKDYCEYKIDNAGNILAHKKGNIIPSKRIMFDAHMDEVGFIITDINSDGTLEFDCVGGINAEVVAARRVYFPDAADGIYGVFGTKPVHCVSKKERENPIDFKSLYIDIGTKSKEETQKLIKRGDMAYFVADFSVFGNSRICSKAIDDRIGCLIMIELIKEKNDYDLWFMFSTAEEIGLRGAACGAYTINPDISIVLETTTSLDINGVEGSSRVCEIGNGATVLYIDRRTIYDRELYKLVTETADKNNIKWQTKTRVAGGNNSGAIQTVRGGARTVNISVPCRYLHSPSTVADLNDCNAAMELAKKFTDELIKKFTGENSEI